MLSDVRTDATCDLDAELVGEVLCGAPLEDWDGDVFDGAPLEDLDGDISSELEGTLPTDTFSLYLGEPRVGHCDVDLSPEVIGLSAWRRVAGRDVVFGLEGDPSALDLIPESRVLHIA